MAAALTEEERGKIWDVINRNMRPDDVDPLSVIREEFDGDEDAYLRCMAKWHSVPVGEAVLCR